MRRFPIIIAAVLAVGSVGCGSSVITYSNLASEEVQSEVADILEKDNLPRQHIDSVLDWTENFNDITKAYELVKDFEPIPEKGLDYSSLMLDDSVEEYSYLQWLNCRLTAFSLIKNQIETARTGTDNDVWLMFDIEAIDTVPECQLTKEQREDFLTLFNHVSVEGTSTVQEHEEKIIEAWQNRKIKILSDDVSLICIYMHSPEDHARFVGHTGVLAKAGNRFLFFEKYGNLAPFQATYFPNKDELKKYLLGRNDIYGDESELEPIITENDKILY